MIPVRIARMIAGPVYAVTALLTLGCPVFANAETAAPQWTVTAVSLPTNFSSASNTDGDSYVVTLTNTGGMASDGTPVTVYDELPAGLALDSSRPFTGEDMLAAADNKPPKTGISCLLAMCTYSGIVYPSQALRFIFPVEVHGGEGAVDNVVRVHGGGAPDAVVETPTTISANPASFGAAPGGESTALSSVQAGAHPDVTVSIAFNTVNGAGSLAGDPKDTIFDLPPGFAGDIVDTSPCADALFVLDRCPTESQVGVTLVTLTNGIGFAKFQFLEPVYELSPNSGEITKLGFSVVGGNFDVEGGISLRPDYGLRTAFRNILEGPTEVVYDELTLWGVPADPIHDPLRWIDGEGGNGKFGASQSGVRRVPFFTNPTACGMEPLEAQFRIDSWESPDPSGAPTGASPIDMPFGPIVGCDRLLMEPSLTAEVSTISASSATGFDLVTEIPQTYENASGLATAALKKEVVKLPEGMTINPSSGAGLAVCSETQYAEEGVEYARGRGCPNESKLATVKITTPSLKEEVTGSVFIATPAPRGESGRNPFNSLLAVYLVARIPSRGVLIKAAGQIEADPLTGRLTTTFDNLPPLPFSVATFAFNQGANAPLVSPPACGDYTVTAALSPWSEPAEKISPLIPPFPIATGVGGSPCPAGGTPPFKPTVISGMQNNAAGSYSPFYLRLERQDGEQEITGFATQLPPGLTGNLTGIPFCGEAQIQHAREQSGAEAESSPACPAASQIGRTIAEAGVGTVLAQTPGRLYLAGPFEGAPFSIASVTSAKVGPFDLGTVVVHLPLRIDPLTAQVTIPSGPADQIPHIIKGIVIHLRDIRVYIDRERFMINPSNCNPMNVSATAVGGGANPTDPAGYDPVTASNRFQDADCQALKFNPVFKVSTSGKTSRKLGASLHVKLTYPKGSLGTQANLRSVKVDLPRQLPSNILALQKACPHATFEADPASCPPESAVGRAVVHTPILPVPLAGPAYFVSYGNEEFPKLIVVLQGYGVTIDLVGNTFIKHGVTSSTFRSTPDTPFESFELTLPQGRYSALSANKDLCKIRRTVVVRKRVRRRVHGRLKTVTVKVRKKSPGLVMPTAFTAQNGAIIHQNTPISVTGCGKHETAHKHKARKAHRRK